MTSILLFSDVTCMAIRVDAQRNGSVSPMLPTAAGDEDRAATRHPGFLQAVAQGAMV
jgi:hypothetical protein